MSIRKIFSTRRRSAFTLVEALIAVVIVTMGSMSTLSLLMATRSHSAQEQERARAHQIATERMERVLHELFPTVVSGEEITVWDNGTPETPYDDTSGTISVSLYDFDGNPISTTPTPWTRVEVEVTVTWTPRARSDDTELREVLMAFMAPHG
jgi:type II secretory pathway pseudopilin PulG